MYVHRLGYGSTLICIWYLLMLWISFWLIMVCLSIHSSSCSVDSMDVQGDYEPMDAGGFIKINALRSRIMVVK